MSEEGQTHELQEYTSGSLPGIFTGISWVPPEDGIDYEPWERLGNILREHRYRTEWDRDRALWWLADWLAFGEDYFGERFAQAFDGTAYSEEGLHNIAYIGRNVAPAQRRDGLGFWKHYEVASLPSRDQDTVLDEAFTYNYSRDQLRERVADLKGHSKPAPSSGERGDGVHREPDSATIPREPKDDQPSEDGPRAGGVEATRIDTPEPTRTAPTDRTACPCCYGGGSLDSERAEEAMRILHEGGFYG